jgi:hypothetical protein
MKRRGLPRFRDRSWQAVFVPDRALSVDDGCSRGAMRDDLAHRCATPPILEPTRWPTFGLASETAGKSS